jgi:hypothetical protein
MNHPAGRNEITENLYLHIIVWIVKVARNFCPDFKFSISCYRIISGFHPMKNRLPQAGVHEKHEAHNDENDIFQIVFHLVYLLIKVASKLR